MSVFNKNIIEVGDCVILKFGHDKFAPKIVKTDKLDQISFGMVKHNDFIGKPYGSKIATAKGFYHVLPLIPEVWSISLPHRTQIIYPHDASIIVGQLDLRPGSIVAEAGTGSGSMTHHLARTVLPNGHVYTFEFHQERAEKANKEFISHGLSNIVTSKYRDVVGEGFPSDLSVDAVILDLPNPVEMIVHLLKIMKVGGRVCFFSPCIEQVQNTCEKLREIKRFNEIETQTMLQRTFNIVKNLNEEPNIGEEFMDGREYCGAQTNAECHANHRTKFIAGSDSTRYDAVPQNNTAGHSGYLTFATFL